MQVSKDSESTAAVVSGILRLEGAGAFYKGMGPKLAQTVAMNSVIFVFYEKIVRLLFKLFNLAKATGAAKGTDPQTAPC